MMGARDNHGAVAPEPRHASPHRRCLGWCTLRGLSSTVPGVRPLATGYRLGARLSHALPAQVLYPLMVVGGAAWFKASRGQQRHALANYGVVLGLPPDHPDVRRVARLAFENYGQMLADFVLLGSLSSAELLRRLTYERREHIDRALTAGRGCVLVVPHMGSWDMAGAAAAAIGYPISAVAERFPGSLDDAVVTSRETFGMGIIPLGRAAVRAVREELEANHVVALACDLPQGPGGADVCFFGRRARVPAGPAAFARRVGSAIVPVSCYRTAPGCYHVELEPAIEVPAGGAERDAQTLVMQRIVDRFEVAIRRRPDQWYAFRPMFS
jgi:lauroyl/myristoyl acyltransferase